MGFTFDVCVVHVVDKITHDGSSGGVKPKLPIKEEQQWFGQMESYEQGSVHVCDVEHITQLHDYISLTPQMHKSNVSTWNGDSDIKMEVDDKGVENKGYGEDAVKAKECIMFQKPSIFSFHIDE